MNKIIGENNLYLARLMGFVLAALLSVMLLLNLASAFGVVTYGDPVKVKPGESIELQFSLQNMVGDTDYNVASQMGAEEGIELVLLDNKDVYEVPLGSEVPVRFRVIVPENAEIGKSYVVSATFTASPSGGNGPLSLQSAVGTKVIILVSDVSDDTSKITPPIYETEKPKSSNNLNVIIIVLIVIAVLLAVYLYASRKRK
ncbi:hypothetical protein J4447_01050 [Candidatus Pacearchaeota archaeon]|nr:hypothetical protein [Candidatus Pacearchaeota archaeon]